MDEKPKIKPLGNIIYGEYKSGFAGNIYEPRGGICPTLKTPSGGMSQPMMIEKKIIARMVGRNPDNPKSRKAGLPTEQMLEPTQHGMIGTLTTTTKDNMVVEITYTARLRRMTPREYWRAMNFTDGDFDKAAAITNETNLYKQAGNSIVKNVLVAILGELIPGKENEYKK